MNLTAKAAQNRLVAELRAKNADLRREIKRLSDELDRLKQPLSRSSRAYDFLERRTTNWNGDPLPKR